jgi:hypothetical protein
MWGFVGMTLQGNFEWVDVGDFSSFRILSHRSSRHAIFESSNGFDSRFSAPSVRFGWVGHLIFMIDLQQPITREEFVM